MLPDKDPEIVFPRAAKDTAAMIAAMPADDRNHLVIRLSEVVHFLERGRLDIALRMLRLMVGDAV